MIGDVAKTLDAFPQVSKLDAPREAGNEDLVSKDGHAVMVTFAPKGTYEEAALYIEKIETAVDKVQKRHAASTSTGSEASARPRRSTRRSTAAREGRDDRDPAHARDPAPRVRLLVAALIPLLLAITAVIATNGVDRAAEPRHPVRRVDRK